MTEERYFAIYFAVQHIDKDNYYSYLGILRSAKDHEIKLAYKQRAFELHPDKNPDDPKAQAKFNLLLEAYETLSHSSLRTEYDQILQNNNTTVAETKLNVQNNMTEATETSTILKARHYYQLWWNIRPQLRFFMDGIDFLHGSFLSLFIHFWIYQYWLTREHESTILMQFIFCISSILFTSPTTKTGTRLFY